MNENKFRHRQVLAVKHDSLLSQYKTYLKVAAEKP
jgi:hypothetical protein